MADLSKVSIGELFARLGDPDFDRRKFDEALDHYALVVAGELILAEARDSGYGLPRADRERAEEMIERGRDYLQKVGLAELVGPYSGPSSVPAR